MSDLVRPVKYNYMLQVVRAMSPVRFAAWWAVNPELVVEYVEKYQTKALERLDALELDPTDPANVPGDEYNAYTKGNPVSRNSIKYAGKKANP